MHRGRVRWMAGTSRLLGVAYDGVADPNDVILDVSHLPDFYAIRNERDELRIGAFARIDAIAREPAIARALGSAPFAPEAARFRLASLGAKLVIAGVGSTRTVPLAEALEPDRITAAEIPMAVEMKLGDRRVAFGDRSIRRVDGAATFDLRVFVGLELGGFHRIVTARVAYSLDHGPPIAIAAVETALRGVMVVKTTLADAATCAASAFESSDDGAAEKRSVLRRTIIPLVYSALNDAYAQSDTPI